MSDNIKFFLTFRARLMLLLSSFLLLTIILVLVLDKWASKRAGQEIEAQNNKVTQAVNAGLGDFGQAMSLATQSLSSEEFLYDTIAPEDLPQTVEVIIVTEKDGKVRDSTRPELVNKVIAVPDQRVAQVRSEDPVHEEDELHEHAPKTYYQPVETTKGLFWIVIVTAQQAIINQIEEASSNLSSRTRELSNYRLWATTGLLVLALAIVVVIGWQFTRPIKELAAAARRVAAGDLDFRVNINRRDEVGQLTTTFNEMIAGLKSKQDLEEKLNQAERAAVIGRLTQSVAHEIRNPLNVINLSIDHVTTKFAPQDETRRKQLNRILTSIKDEVARLKNMVNDLLNYGRPAQLSVETIDMRKLMDETLALVRPQADEQGVEVNIEEGGSLAQVKGDPERLKSCLSNIAINALQAMPAGGRLSARVARADGMVEVSISDTGVGISEEALGKIFEPYFSTKRTGFGLGLALTKKIIEEHQGAIDVESEVNRGTTFTVKLPATSV